MATTNTQTATPISRMQLLRGDFKGREHPLRPPWAIAENLFTEICTACGDCISHCPENLIKAGRAGYPVVDFSQGECSFCEACVEHCQPRALLKTEGAPWQLQAVIDSSACIAFAGVECRSCQDPCEQRAISMPPQPGGISRPRIDSLLCNGCGACVAPCPTGAIGMQIQDDTKANEV